MRASDVIGLALEAMRQRKARVALAVVGVSIGSFVLVASLALGRGISEAILQQLRKQDQLRRVIVWPGGGPKAGEGAEEEPEVPGEMSAARRERLREALKQRRQAPGKMAPLGLKPEQIEAMRRLDHVEAVVPSLRWTGTVGLSGRPAKETVGGAIRTASADDPGVRRRIVAGRAFQDDGEEGLLVSEFAVYHWGRQDEAAVEGVLDRQALLRVQQRQPGLGNLLYLLNVGRPNLTEAERRVLGQVLAKLPAAIEEMKFPPEDRKVLLELLRKSRPGAERAEELTLPIVGVFRDVARSEVGPFDEPPRPVEVIVSPGVARSIFFRSPGMAEQGLPQVSVRVDHERNLRRVETRIKEMGHETFSLADLLDQVQLNVLLVSIACTFVAVIALLVAAIGITNTMLMSVMERRHEIGVMKAVGGRDGQVLAVFLVEGALVGAIGALLGLAAAWLVSFPGDRIARDLVAAKTPMQLEQSVFAFPWWLIVGVPLAVCALTTLAGLYPARRAARIDPIEALRQR